MATITTTQRLISDLTETVPRTTIHSDTDPLFVIDRDGNTGLLTNDQRTDRSTGDPDYRYAVFSTNGIYCDFGSTTGLARSETEVVDLNNFTLYWTNTANQTGQGAVNTSTGTANGNLIAGTVRLANGTFIFGNTSTAIFGSFQGGVNSLSDFDDACHYIADYDNITFIKDEYSTAATTSVQLRSAHPTLSSLSGLTFGAGVLPGFNSATPTFGTQLEGANLRIFQITDGAGGDVAISTDNWTPHSHLDLTRTSGSSYIRAQRGVRLWFLNIALPVGAGSFRFQETRSASPSTVQYGTVWQARFKRDDDESDVSTKIRFDDSQTIYAMPEEFAIDGSPSSIVTDGNLAENFVNGNTYIIDGGGGDVTTVSNQNSSGPVSHDLAERTFRHYAQELNLDSQNLTIGSYTINGSTVFGSEMTGLLTAMDTDYIELVDVLGAQVTTAEGIATTFVVDNTDKLYQSVKSRYVEDAPDLDFSSVVTTPTGSSINFGDNDITWEDGTTEAIAINSDGDITVTTDTIGTLSNGAFTSDITTTGDVNLAGTSLSSINLDAGGVTNLGGMASAATIDATSVAISGGATITDNSRLTASGAITNIGDVSSSRVDGGSVAFATGTLVFDNATIESDAAIALSSDHTYGGSTLTSTLTGATNFNNVPVNLSNVTLVGSNTLSIAGIDGSAPHTSTDVTWDGVVNFDDTADGIVHIFNGTTFTSLPTNTAGGGVSFQLGVGDTLMSTFGQDTAPAGFTQIFDPLVLTISNPSTTTFPYTIAYNLTDGDGTVTTGTIAQGVADVIIELERDTFGTDATTPATLVVTGRGFSDFKEDISFDPANLTFTPNLSFNPLASAGSVTNTLSTTFSGTVFRIQIPAGTTTYSSAGAANVDFLSTKGTVNYANYIAATNASMGLGIAVNGGVIFYGDGTNIAGIEITAGGLVSPPIQFASFISTAGQAVPGQLLGDAAAFNSAIVQGLTIYFDAGASAEGGVTDDSTSLGVVAEPDSSVDYPRVSTELTSSLIQYGAATGGEDSDISSITDAIAAQTEAIVGTGGESLSGIKSDTEALRSDTQAILESD